MEFKVRFDCNNSAFDDNLEAEISRILRELANRVENGDCTGLFQNIKDSNGNIIGTFKLAKDLP